MMKKHTKMSKKVFLLGLGLFWSSKEVKMTKCCLVCIQAQALVLVVLHLLVYLLLLLYAEKLNTKKIKIPPLEEAWGLW